MFNFSSFPFQTNEQVGTTKKFIACSITLFLLCILYKDYCSRLKLGLTRNVAGEAILGTYNAAKLLGGLHSAPDSIGELTALP